MVTYEYRCTVCESPVFLPFRARPGHPYVHHTDEEICQGTLKRVYSLGGISFKGSGFYSNEPQ